MESCQEIARENFGKYRKIQRFRTQSVQLMCDSKTKSDDTPPKHLAIYPGNVFEEVHYQFQPFSANHQRAKSCFGNEDQPKPSGEKWTAKQIKSNFETKFCIQSEKKFKSMRKILKPTRGSFGEKHFEKTLHVIKFPSQKAIISKEKVVSIKNHEKEKYEIEICRIFKKNYVNQMEEYEKENEAFLSEQAMMIRNSFPESKSSTVVFDYDGSLLAVASPKNHPQNLIIECTGSEVFPSTFQKSVSNKSQRKKVRQKTKREEEEVRFGDYVNAESICSKYIENFRKIPWNSKVSVINNPKLMNGYKDIRTMDEYVEPVKENEKNMKTCLSAKEEDEKAVVRVFNNEIYNEQLIKKGGENYEGPLREKQNMKNRNSILLSSSLNKNMVNKMKNVSIGVLPERNRNEKRWESNSFVSEKDNEEIMLKENGRGEIKNNNFVGKNNNNIKFAKNKVDGKIGENNKIVKKARQNHGKKQSNFSSGQI